MAQLDLPLLPRRFEAKMLEKDTSLVQAEITEFKDGFEGLGLRAYRVYRA